MEIDGHLLDVGRTHPDRPYDDPRVDTHVADGRAFLEATDRRWDTILLALPDSLTLLQGQSSVRLESYLFTAEAVESYREHLADGGTFAMYNYYREPWLVDRYAATLADVFGQAPVREHGAGHDPVGARRQRRSRRRSSCPPGETFDAAPATHRPRPPTTTRSPTCAPRAFPASTSSPSPSSSGSRSSPSASPADRCDR